MNVGPCDSTSLMATYIYKYRLEKKEISTIGSQFINTYINEHTKSTVENKIISFFEVK